MRVTGLATGMDIDQLVKDSMKPYRMKIDVQQQQKDIIEIKQQLYRDLINDSRELYNKYFDVAKTDSLLLSKNWSTVKFQSSNENVLTVTGGSDVKPGNYTVTGTSASAAKAVVTAGINKSDKLVINGKEFTLKGDTEKSRAENLNKELKEAGINVAVKYSDFAGTEAGNQSGFIFESTVLGKDSTFTIGGTNIAVGTIKTGVNATAATVTGFTIDDLKNAGGKLSIDGEEIVIPMSDTNVNEDIEKLLQSKLKGKNLSAKVDDSGNITFSSTVLGSKIEDPNIKINGNNGEFKQGIDATYTTNTLDINDIKGEKISINGNVIDLSKAELGKELEYLNEMLKKQNINVTAKVDKNDSSKIVLTSNRAGADSKVDVGILNGGTMPSSQGTDAAITIKDGKGGVYNHTGNSNSVTLDGITFKFTGEIPAEGITVTGKNDITEIKDKLVNFISDYNKLMEKLNTATMEKRNKNYMPLTEEQKKGMSETEIKLWNEKVTQGQLYKDSDISRIANSMKSAMRGLVDGADGNLEKFGIKPTADYKGTKNGTFTIDEEKLTKTLEENSEGLMKFFTNTPPSVEGISDQDKYNRTGVAQRLKSILYNETVTTSSVLIKKAGIEGSATITNNELTKSIEKYERKMKDMEIDFTRREQQLYSKWATIESIMNKLNSQQSYLTSQLGM
jgi:flagellar hook-associated protein 2